MFVPIYICIILSMYAIHRFSFFDTDVSTLSLIDADADAVAPNSSTRSYTRGSVPSSLIFREHALYNQRQWMKQSGTHIKAWENW